MDLSSLQQAWALPGPWHLAPLAYGTNNLVQRVQTPAGSYVLRVYRNHADLSPLRFEAAILTRLQGAGLPYAVPAPIPTAAGEHYERLTTEEGEALATLTPLIPGEHPRRDDLAHCHPLVPDPLTAIEELPMAAEARQRLAWRYTWLTERIPRLYASLPQQLTHEDYGPDNVLMDGVRVTGVLDFEFCARDVRVMDVTVALSWWPIAQFGSGAEWPIVRAFVEGYARHVALTAAEAEAIPTLFQLRAYTSLIHRLGRHRQGLSPLEAVIQRAEAALERESWLRAHGERLVREVRDVGVS
jgi:homoserine kinase type II